MLSQNGTTALIIGNNNTIPQVNLDRVHEIYTAIERHPDSTAREIGDRLGLSYNQVRAALPTLEYRGYLLGEDDSGHLRACGRANDARERDTDRRIMIMHAFGFDIAEISSLLFGYNNRHSYRRIRRLVPG